MTNNEVNNKHKNKYGKLKTNLYVSSFIHKIFPGGRLIKKQSRLCANGVMKQ